jgi:hypothetical protein
MPAGNIDVGAVGSGLEIGEYRGVVRVPWFVFLRLLAERPIPEKLPRRQLTEDGNVEISGRDLG